jgi:hypothetical protein
MRSRRSITGRASTLITTSTATRMPGGGVLAISSRGIIGGIGAIITGTDGELDTAHHLPQIMPQLVSKSGALPLRRSEFLGMRQARVARIGPSGVLQIAFPSTGGGPALLASRDAWQCEYDAHSPHRQQTSLIQTLARAADGTRRQRRRCCGREDASSGTHGDSQCAS